MLKICITGQDVTVPVVIKIVVAEHGASIANQGFEVQHSDLIHGIEHLFSRLTDDQLRASHRRLASWLHDLDADLTNESVCVGLQCDNTTDQVTIEDTRFADLALVLVVNVVLAL